jgi:inorganic pyrophosphatase
MTPTIDISTPPTHTGAETAALGDGIMNLEALTIGSNSPEEVNVVIEVPIGGEPIKYEFDKASGALVVDRFLYTPMRYPGNYGFIPKTLSEDGDPCDALIANSRALIPGAVIAVRPIGVLIMQDEAGPDEKIIAVPTTRLTRRYDGVLEFSDLPEITLRQIEHFFTHYKDLEVSKWVKIARWGDAAEAKNLVQAAEQRYRQNAGRKGAT